MDPSEFRNSVVILDVNDLKAKYDDIRAAYHAVASVDALAAHIFQWSKKNNVAGIGQLRDDSEYRNFLQNKIRISDFCVISQRLRSTSSWTAAILKLRELETSLLKASVEEKLRGMRLGGIALRRS